ncbi:unnamed protein product [Prorocentrum cordatum]|uniref:Uncharacterized protein n=1 Tax=Prorocentrum cordatum TaxID=2364126 RepID=A0ABN9RRG5_9DINO|nr:unnamed protein product [Polarella glacialis]
MWARRVGLRPQWPSRIRVFAMSCSSITAGLVIYQYLSSMMVSDLDLTQPVHDEILCLAHWPLIYSSDGDKGWLDQGAWFNWSKALLNRDDFVRDSQCRFVSADRGPGSIAGQRDAPLSSVTLCMIFVPSWMNVSLLTATFSTSGSSSLASSCTCSQNNVVPWWIIGKYSSSPCGV